MPEASRRVFLALWPDPAVADALFALAGDALARCRGRRTRRDTLHLTLDFIGDVAESRLPALIDGLAAVRGEAFALHVDTLGYFPHNHIVWAGFHARPPALEALVASIRDVLGGLGLAGADKLPFFAHVTLVRKAEQGGALPEVSTPIAWQVPEWALMESCRTAQGSTYRRLAGWSLA